MPPAIAGTRASARKLWTGMNGLSQCQSPHWPLWGHVQFNLAFSLEETSTFGRVSSHAHGMQSIHDPFKLCKYLFHIKVFDLGCPARTEP